MGNIGLKIKKARIDKEITQQELAEKSGISRISISKYERGDRIPSPRILKELSKVIDIDIDGILSSSESRLNEAIKNIESEIVEEGNFDNLVYQKGKLDGLRLALKILKEGK